MTTKPEPTKENSIYVIGEARPKGSHAAIPIWTRNGQKAAPYSPGAKVRAQIIPASDKGHKLKKWEEAVKAQAGRFFLPISGPEKVAVWLSFNMKDGTAYRLDVDKLVRSTLDGLKGCAYDDDKQAKELHVTSYITPSGVPSGCWIMYAPMELDALNQGAHI